MLSMNSCNLRSLQNMPRLSKLKSLDLSDNRLTEEDIYLLIQYYGGNRSRLEMLKLSNNYIRDFKSLEVLKDFKNLPDGRDAVSLGQTPPLINLDLSGNPVTEV